MKGLGLWLKTSGDDLCLFVTLEFLVLKQMPDLHLSPLVMNWATFVAASMGVAHKVFFPAAKPLPQE